MATAATTCVETSGAMCWRSITPINDWLPAFEMSPYPAPFGNKCNQYREDWSGNSTIPRITVAQNDAVATAATRSCVFIKKGHKANGVSFVPAANPSATPRPPRPRRPRTAVTVAALTIRLT